MSFLSHRHLRYSTALWGRRILFSGGAVLVALVVIGFAAMAQWADRAMQWLIGIHPVILLIATPMGFWLAMTLTRRFFPGAEGSGIPQTIAALQMSANDQRRSTVLSLRLALGKLLMTCLALTVGASIGREGPSVQIGASILHGLGQGLRMSGLQMQRTLILAGGACGVAAAFNTPLAGLVFAIEELSRSFEAKTSMSVLGAVILAGIVTLAILGNYHYFGHSGATLDLGRAWSAILVCGIGGGVLGGGFSQILILVARKGLPGRTGFFQFRHPALFAGLCGLIIALIGLASGGSTYGTGYEQARDLVLDGSTPPVLFTVLKLLATIVSYISGIPGGIFSPSLAIGAGLGADIAEFFPSFPVAALVLLGMVGYFSGVVQAPITAVIIVLEMTDNSAMTIPLMATALLAFMVSRLICPVAFYKAMAENFLRRPRPALSTTL